MCDSGDGVVVKADDREVFGYADPLFFQGLEEYSSKKIIGYEGAVWADLPGKDLPCGAQGGGFAKVVDQEEIGVIRQAIVGEGLLVALESPCIDISSEVGGDVGDAAAALGGEVGGGFIPCTDIVDDYAGAEGEVLDAVEENDRDAFFYEGVEVIQVCGVEGEGGDEAVHAFVEEVVCVGGLFAIGLGGVADDEVVTGLGHDFFDAGEDGAYELAFKLVDDDADGVGLLHPEVAGEAVGAVAHFFGGVHDPLPCFAIDGGVVFQAPADSGG